MDRGGSRNQPFRKQVSIQSGPHGVDKNDVEITVKPSVLEPIVENQHVEGARIVMEHLSRDSGSISTHQERQQRMPQAILGRLVGTGGLIGLVTTHRYRRAETGLLQGPCEMTADRCLPCSPDGQVSHR